MSCGKQIPDYSTKISDGSLSAWGIRRAKKLMVCTGLKNWSVLLLADVLSLWKKVGQFELRLPYLGHMYVGPRNRTHCPNADEHVIQRTCIVCVTQTSWKKAHKETQIFKLWLSWLCVVYERIGCRLFLNLDLTSIIPRHIFKCFSASISQQTNLLCRL